MTTAAVAQTAGGGGTQGGSDQEASGELLGDGQGAAVGAGSQTSTPGGGSGGGGGGGTGPGITCRLALPLGPQGGIFPSAEELTGLYDAAGQQPIPVHRTCYDANGAFISNDGTTWAPAAGGPVLVDPQVLAEIARSRMTFPAPVVSTSPPADEGTYAQLPTFFLVENWAASSTSATAGPVTATVSATPVRQTWVIQDTYRGTSETVSCDGPGSAFDPSLPVEAQLPPACGWTPAHSSAGQTQTGSTGEACFPATVTLAWDVRWGSNIGVGGALGEGTSSTGLCLVVAELQAVVVNNGA